MIFTVVGNQEVAGKKRGENVTIADLGLANIEALIQAGHIEVQVISSEDPPVSIEQEK